MKLLETLGYRIPAHSPLNKSLEGANEIDMVYSGLEEYMTKAVSDHWEYSLNNNLNFSDACLVQAITKLNKHYEICGISM